MTPRLRVAIVDDEAPARAILREYLGQDTDVEIVAECANGFEAVRAVATVKPDVLFLDVQMPSLNGFEVLELIERDVAVVFVTAYDEFALKAFEVQAVDYLLKPFPADRLKQALTHVRERIARGTAVAPRLSSALAPGGPLRRVLIRDGPTVHIVAAMSIDYIEAQDDYVSIRAAGRAYLKEQTMTSIQAQLDPVRFVRIHRSYLLNVERLVRVEATDTDSRIAVLEDGTRLPISRSGHARLAPHLG